MPKDKKKTIHKRASGTLTLGLPAGQKGEQRGHGRTCVTSKYAVQLTPEAS